MSEKKWTEQQRSAIDATGGTLLVSAAAGSGKTAVLVQRVIEKLTADDPEIHCDADRLLIVTFTRAAAAEMKERISPSASAMKEMLFAQDVAGLAAHLGNVFEQVLRVEECEKIKRIMMDGGALGACMTGSGSTVFGIFSDEELANQTCKQCLCSYKNTFLTQAVGHGCEIISSDQ